MSNIRAHIHRGWGNSWRDHREFVGQLKYGVRYQLWQPALTATKYGPAFRAAVRTLLGCQRRVESPVALLPDEAVYYILNMCRWDWWNDASVQLQAQRRRLRRTAHEEAETTRAPSAEAPHRMVANQSQPMELSQHDTQDSHSSDDANEGMDEDTEDEEEEEWREEDEDEGEEREEDSDSDESAWENGYRADTHVFAFRDVSSDEDSEGESDEDPEAAAAERQAWFRRHFARIHILRALARAGDDNDDATG